MVGAFELAAGDFLGESFHAEQVREAFGRARRKVDLEMEIFFGMLGASNFAFTHVVDGG